MPRRSSLTPEEPTGALERYLQPTGGTERETESARESDGERDTESHTSMSSASDGFLSPEVTERRAAGGRQPEAYKETERDASESDAEEVWADAENTESGTSGEKEGQAAGGTQSATGGTIDGEAESIRQSDKERETESHTSMSSASDGFLSPEDTETYRETKRDVSGWGADGSWADAENTEGGTGREKEGQAAGGMQRATADTADDVGGDTTEEEDLDGREIHPENSGGAATSAGSSVPGEGAAAGVQAALEFAERGWSEGGSSTGLPATPTPTEVLRLLEEMQRTAASVPSDPLQREEPEGAFRRKTTVNVA